MAYLLHRILGNHDHLAPSSRICLDPRCSWLARRHGQRVKESMAARYVRLRAFFAVPQRRSPRAFASLLLPRTIPYCTLLASELRVSTNAGLTRVLTPLLVRNGATEHSG